MAGDRLLKVGVAAVALALLGWLVTGVAVAFGQQSDTTEDLTAAWTRAGPTPLGQSAAVAVPPGQTLVAFLVGTDLLGIAGTTGGSCAATSGDQPVDLGWPVQVNRSLTGILTANQETVAIAGWTNRSEQIVTVEIRCTTEDSTVDHFVAVPSRTASVIRDPWFQPWAWIALGSFGAALTVSSLVRINRPSP